MSISFWTQIRWRLGGSDAVMNRINDLIQKQILANAETQDVTVEEILNPIITLPSKVVMRDNLFKSHLRSITQGQIAYFPVDPDLQLMRLWILNEHGGRNLTDHSFMQNTIQLNGTDQTKLVWANDDDGVSGSPIVNRLIDDQYIRVEDNPNVQIKNIAATAQGISIFLRLWIEYARSEHKFQKPNTLFSKIDSEQVDYAYAAYLYDNGAISFFVRDNRKEYSVVAPSGSIVWTNINLPDYSETDYTPADYYTLAHVPGLPNPTPYVDLCFTYNFTTHRLEIIRSDLVDGPGIIVASSSTALNGIDGPLTTNLKGWWKMTEGGPVGTTPVQTINDLSTNALNATAVNPLWDSTTSNIIFLGNNGYVPIPTNTAGKQINNLTTAVTFAAWARIDATQGGYAGLVSNLNGRSDGNKILVRNVGANTEVLWRGHNGTNPVDTLAVLADANLVGDTLWHHYAVVYDAATVKIFVDGQLIFSEPQSYTLASGTSNMTIGWGSTNTSLYHLTGSIQDVLLYNIALTDAQILELYEQGQRISYFPKWRADPPTEPPPPSPTSNPFQNVYNVPLPTNTAERDMVRLHQITATSLTQRYTVGQGAQEDAQPVTEDNMYDNWPTYDTGTAVQEVPSIYAKSSTVPAVGAYLKLNSATFSGEKFVTGSGDDIIGKPITKVVAKLADVNPNNTPASGLITCRIVRPDGQSQTTSATSYDAIDLPDNQGGGSTTNWATVAFTFPGNNYATPTGAKIQFEFDRNGAVPVTLTGYNQLATASAAGYFLSINQDRFGGQRFLAANTDVIGKVVSRIDVKMADFLPTTAPATGDIVAKIVSSSNAEFAISTPVDAGTLADNASGQSNTWSTHTFNFPTNNHPMASGDRIQFEFDEGGTPGTGGDPFVNVFPNLNTNDTDAGIIDFYSAAGQWIDNSSSSLAGKVISKVVVKIAKYQSNPTGAMICRIMNMNNNPPSGIGASSTVNANTVTGDFNAGTWTNVTFNFPANTPALQPGHLIVFFMNEGGPGSGSGQCVVAFGQTTQNNSHVYVSAAGQNPVHANNLDVCMDVFTGTGTAAPIPHVGFAISQSDAEANSDIFYANYTSPSTVTTSAAGDILMDVYAGSITLAKTVGVAYGTNLIANHLAYEGSYTGTISDKTTFDLALDVFIDKKTGAPNHQYTQLQNAGNKFVGEFINATSSKLFGQKLTKITARIHKVGLPTGNLFCRIRKGAGGPDVTFGLQGSTTAPGLDVSTLTTTNNPAAEYIFMNDANKEDTGYALTTGDRIIFELSGGASDATKYVMIAKTTGSSAIPDVHLQTSAAGSTWTTVDSQTADHLGRMWIGGGFTQTKYPFHNLGYENSRVVQKVTSNNTTDPGNMYNQKVTRVQAWLMRVGSPQGQVNCVIRKGANDSDVVNINVYNAIDISDTGFQLIPFMNLNNTYPLAVGDRISLELSGGDINNHIRVNTNLLSTYPYGNLEVYTAGNYVTKISHDLAGTMSIGGGATDPLARTRVAERVATTNSLLKLKKISRVRIWVRKQSDPKGSVVIRIRNSANVQQALIGSIDAETQITSDPTETTVTSSPISVYPLQVGDYVSVEYNGGDDNNFVEVMTSKTTDLFDGVVNTYVAKWDDFNWANNTAIDLIGRMDEGGDTFTPSQEDVIIPPPFYTKDLTVLAGGPPWSYIDHTTSTLTHAPSQLFTNAVMPDFRFYRKVLTIAELTNIFTNRIDRADIAYGEVARVGFFAVSEQ